jgi:GNAT superfamily N-acetyltransferase
MQPYLRDAVRGDVPAIVAILREATRHDPVEHETGIDTYRDALAEIDRRDGCYVLVAEYDHQIVAVLQLLTFRHLHRGGGRCAEIVTLEVADAYRTTGIGGMLLDHAIARVRDLGCTRLQAVVAGDRTGEHAFWERGGFVHLARGYVRPLA